MGTYGDLWGPMGIYGDWGLRRAMWSYGDPMGTHGDPWGPSGTYGYLWGHVGTLGTYGAFFRILVVLFFPTFPCWLDVSQPLLGAYGNLW